MQSIVEQYVSLYKTLCYTESPIDVQDYIILQLDELWSKCSVVEKDEIEKLLYQLDWGLA